jgi:hypothetical protein
VDALLERLRDFIRLNYMTAAEVARQIGVRDATIYDWLLGTARPAEPQRIAAFLGVCPNCEARGPKRGSGDEALRAWNGRVRQI